MLFFVAGSRAEIGFIEISYDETTRVFDPTRFGYISSDDWEDINDRTSSSGYAIKKITLF